jgi:multidrug resistance efflux pump
MARYLQAVSAKEVAESALKLANVTLEDQKDRYKRAEGLKSGRSISEERLKGRYYAVKKAEPDLQIKKDMLKSAASGVNLAKVELEKTEVKAPISGTILKVRIRPGEFISGNEQDITAPILLANTDILHVRVQIDENDIWRFDKSLAANAYLRSNNNVKMDLSFVRMDPYAQRKQNLRGTGTELIDTRIIEVIYKIDVITQNLLIGQQLDVFIQSDHSP